ncbi:MAG TPA: hypothetical protein VI698_01260 [Nitrososphaerales archaeon]|nr:hypothetical protein [Nitrososphaerales archaeon]
MDIHPSKIPVSKSFDIKDQSDVGKVISEMLAMDFKERGFKILMPKEQNLAKRLGYIIVNELNKGLRMQRYPHKIRYFVYHHDPEHYAIVIVSEETFAKLHA